MKINPPFELVALSALLVDLGGAAPSEIKLIPAGSFRSARDARPVDVPAWVMDDAIAAAVLSAQAALKGKFLFDYDHQTLRAEKNGQPAPAAGWGGRLEWRSGDGLYAVDMDWTQAALSAIAAKEYRYISPVFLYDKKTGAVTSVKMAALTNYPALDDLTDLAAAAAEIYSTSTSTPQETAMDPKEIIERLIYLLNLPVTATIDEIGAELDKLKAMIAQPDGATVGLSALLAAKDEELVALSAQATAMPDLAKFAPIAVVNELRDQLAALSGNVVDDRVEKLIEQGWGDGRITGIEERTWLTAMGKENFAMLQGTLESRPIIRALKTMQTEGKAPDSDASKTVEGKGKQEFQTSAALQAEFGDEATYLSYLAAQESGSVKILGGKQ
jgi:phage I-like protein